MNKKDIVSCFEVILQFLALIPSLTVYLWILYSLKAPVWIYILYGFGFILSVSIGFLIGIVRTLMKNDEDN